MLKDLLAISRLTNVSAPDLLTIHWHLHFWQIVPPKLALFRLGHLALTPVSVAYQAPNQKSPNPMKPQQFDCNIWRYKIRENMPEYLVADWQLPTQSAPRKTSHPLCPFAAKSN